ncbi:hypothetical protein F3B42_10570 [Bacteroides ovatus]|uniref:Uncharacterized protein n=1 Tax=Bacteroides ovatus TaxID=28116 RepID=A0A7J4XYH0_BACOV|nr:hypothetical protein F3B90_11295 [Bacteroides ovatus]KAA4641411.1 hypothetical protein F3B52_05220 [Bacteroides ovatus]KAA4672903.1 hypothetical protein F3B42_10570 [Bacteroides ovatus]KAA4681871.1 hypothetical protein F3B41_12405 [Bacteroides ovatus]
MEKAGVLYLRFFCYLYVLFSFVLIQQKKYPKEKIKAAPARLLRFHSRLKGRNSLRSNSLPFLTPVIKPSLDAVQTRPEEDHAVW